MAQPRTRKNIDSLTPQELADYEHAFAKLKEISDADPSSIDGLQYFTDLPVLLVGLHMLGACLVWVATLAVVWSTRMRTSARPADAPPALEPAVVSA